MNTYCFLISAFLLIKNTLSDSICGNDQRFLVALKCGDQNSTLYCAPNNLKDRTEFCMNPNKKWATAKCINKGGLTSIDIDNTGCYTLSKSYWGHELSCDSENFIPETNINSGFELGTLDKWEYSGPSSPVVHCDSSAPEGSCYVELSTYGTSPWTESNIIKKSDLTVSNYGGCNNDNYKLVFWYKFTAGDYIPFNDNLKIYIKNQDDNLIYSQVLDVATVGNFGSSSWLNANVFLGQVPIGSSLSIIFSAETTNELDGALTSYGYVDGFKIVKV